jgi:hypothetical protein
MICPPAQIKGMKRWKCTFFSCGTSSFVSIFIANCYHPSSSNITGHFFWNTLNPPDVLSLKRVTNSLDKKCF